MVESEGAPAAGRWSPPRLEEALRDPAVWATPPEDLEERIRSALAAERAGTEDDDRH
ncbi:hypothetical protein GA0070611_0674 [Micromonospora auratinigra]|uniref:Uncharacterized protein n=1 Tax=Micromonospora auratinigra TaxID=261654 RepID=A0A1A8Z4K9_9ACTN|nr:hypothetical protein GA0070611_0674 [Micromonospora auratinigra]